MAYMRGRLRAVVGGSVMTTDVSRPASKLTDIKPDGLAGGESGLLELRYYLGAMTMNGDKRWH